MSTNIFSSASHKGILKVEVLTSNENERFIAAVVHESRRGHRGLFDLLEPVIIFKESFRAKDYDLLLNLAIDAGYPKPLPEVDAFKANYHGIKFFGYSSILKLYGYNSGYTPYGRKLSHVDMAKKAEEWLADIEDTAEVIFALHDIISTTTFKGEQLEKAKEWLRAGGLRKEIEEALMEWLPQLTEVAGGEETFAIL